MMWHIISVQLLWDTHMNIYIYIYNIIIHNYIYIYLQIDTDIQWYSYQCNNRFCRGILRTSFDLVPRVHGAVLPTNSQTATADSWLSWLLSVGHIWPDFCGRFQKAWFALCGLAEAVVCVCRSGCVCVRVFSGYKPLKRKRLLLGLWYSYHDLPHG